MSRTAGSLAAAAVAWWIAAALQIPVWRDWTPGDRADITVTTFLAAWWLSKRPASPPAFMQERGE